MFADGKENIRVVWVRERDSTIESEEEQKRVQIGSTEEKDQEENRGSGDSENSHGCGSKFGKTYFHGNFFDSIA